MGSKLREKELLAEIDRLKKIIDELKTSKPYGLVWEDKPEQFESYAENAVPVLKTKGGKFKDVELDPSSDHNVLIEGDNYHALSVLSYTHRGKIDVIYIDPPYNTGNKDFRYNDNFVERDDIYRHSKWLSFMAKRLALAKDILADQGILFISIDDNEHANLKNLCDSLFGDNNFIGTITWEKRTKAQNTETAKEMFQSKTEYILVYDKNESSTRFKLEVVGQKTYDLEDEHGPYRLKRIEEMSALGMRGRETMVFAIEGVLPRSGFQWKYGKAEVDKYRARGDLLVVDNRPHFKVRPHDETIAKFIPFWSHFFDKDTYGTSEKGKTELTQILGNGAHEFETVKPVNLVKKLLFHINNPDAIVADFFAGSGTTGHAVLELNKQDGGNRRFILCTNNENNICEDVTYERIKRVMKGYTTPAGEQVDGLGGNLKYLKTEFVKKELPVGLSDEAKLKLTHRANVLLSLRENTFTPVEATDYYEVTASPTKITAVYFREDKTELTTMLDKLLDLSGNKPVTVYIFAWEKGAYKAGVPGYPFDFQDIPEPIVEVYQSIGY